MIMKIYLKSLLQNVGVIYWSLFNRLMNSLSLFNEDKWIHSKSNEIT
jgi:hypothetical protein